MNAHLQPQYGVYCQLRKVFLVLDQDFTAQSRPGNVQQILLEFISIVSEKNNFIVPSR